jgi:pyridoxal phosphate enzyme (YggS family)
MSAANDAIASRLASVRQRIELAALAAGRRPESITLLAVSKTKPAEAVRAAFAAGCTEFGENYLQEGICKARLLADLPLHWHFIGPIQANKTRPIAEQFDWVHSVDRLKVAQRLSAQRPAEKGPLQICLQLNVSGEASKRGVDVDELAALAAAVERLPNLRLRGLMAIPAPSDDPVEQRTAFAAVRHALEQLQQRWPQLDTLSMGMSGDLEAAIAEGATIVRVGTDIFGARG